MLYHSLPESTCCSSSPQSVVLCGFAKLDVFIYFGQEQLRAKFGEEGTKVRMLEKKMFRPEGKSWQILYEIPSLCSTTKIAADIAAGICLVVSAKKEGTTKDILEKQKREVPLPGTTSEQLQYVLPYDQGAFFFFFF